MLEAAINAFLDSNQFFVALNLAAVAEELYGRIISLNGAMNSQTSLIRLARDIARIEGAGELKDGDLTEVSVMYKNAIKHLDTREQRLIEIDVEDEARSTIGCALTNHAKLNRQFTPTVQRFYDFGRFWAQEHLRGDIDHPPIAK